LIFVQDFTAQDEHGHAVGGNDAAEQARFALEKIRRCLEAAGATFADVCKVTVFPVPVAPAMRPCRFASFGSK